MARSAEKLVVAISALDVINDGLAKNDFSGKQASGSKFACFAPASFPGIFSVKDSEIFNSTLGRVFPICDRGISNLLGAKPIDGLRLSQSTWLKSENLLRNSSQVLSTAEHYLSAAGSLLNQLEVTSQVLSTAEHYLSAAGS